MDPLKIEEEKFQFSFEDEMDHPLKIEDEMEPLRNDDTMDLIMEMSNKKRQETVIDLRNCPPRESLRPVYPRSSRHAMVPPGVVVGLRLEIIGYWIIM
jgi:hypothetical protein